MVINFNLKVAGMAQYYKSVSFPKSINKNKRSKILKLAINENDKELINIIRDLDSSQMRMLLNDHSIEQLEQLARSETRSLNNTCLLMIKENLAKYKIQNKNQLNLFFSNPFNGLKISKNSGTFKNNKKQGIFNWYPYIEGFSHDFVEEICRYRYDNSCCQQKWHSIRFFRNQSTYGIYY